MIRGEVLGGNEVGKFLAERKEKIIGGMSATIARLVITLQRNVKIKLSGGVLNVRTGRLRRSINMELRGVDTPQVEGRVGTNVVYARPNEFGYNGTVKEHMRTIKEAFGKPLKAPVTFSVPAHTTHLPERSFLRSALAELQPEIKRSLKGAATEMLK